MKAGHQIPQHPLLDQEGQPVNFDIQYWGGPHNYDFLKAHRHHFHELLVFEKGKAQHDIDFKTYEARVGSIHFVASENVHLVIRGKTCSGFSLLFTTDYFSRELLAQLPFSKEHPCLHLATSDLKSLQNLVKDIQKESQAKKPLGERIRKSLMETLLLRLAQNYQADLPKEDLLHVPEHLQAFKRLVKENYLKHLSVEMYAGLLHISAKHLIDLCKKHTGQTALKLIKDHTIYESKKLLFHTTYKIKEIAYQLNFEDPAHFSKYFKAHTGYTPLAYRKTQVNN